ncbi:MAG: Gfo/Idh/MocA family oxidoreductase [Clostridia bacterium]|nr:Gfo/Idh/MocA family oxidoreductase [Clostridia bacterium]
MLKAAIIGFGSISRVHRKAYLKLEQLGKVKLTCAYDIEPEAFRKTVKNNLDESAKAFEEQLNYYTDLDEMLANEEIDFVDICAPTYMHSKLAIELLGRGYHVLCEKPMSLCYADCLQMIDAAKTAEKELMIGQCLRFYPGFDYIKGIMDEKRYGEVLGAFFMRLSPPPTWGQNNWFADPALSGGGITDFHIHDVDMIRYLFGEPEAVTGRGTSSFSVYDTVHTSLFYGDYPVTAIADWTRVGIPFSATCSIDFEKATVNFDGTTLTIYPKDGSPAETVPLEDQGGYYGEIDYFCDVVSGKTKNTKNPATSAAMSLRLIEHIRQSADAKGKIVAFSPDH